MLCIRQTQLQAFALPSRDAFIKEMVIHLRTFFPATAWLLTIDELRDHIGSCINRAGRYQLNSRRQVCRFINLAASYGWNFDSDPQLSWMREILLDTSLAAPGERLDQLMQNCLRRQEIEERNLALRRRLGVAEPANIRPERAHDYLGAKRTRQHGDKGVAHGLLSPNPRKYLFSKCLWQADEALPCGTDAERKPLAWVDNSPSSMYENGAHHVSKQN